MRHGSTGRRVRNRGNGGRRGNQSRAQVFDSNGPDVRIRGTAHQVCEKYMSLSKEAASSGDYVLSQSYSQHAEHYQRVINAWQADSKPVEQSSAQKDTSNNTIVKEKSQSGNSAQKPEQAVVTEDKEDLGLPESIVGGKVKEEVILEDV